MDDGDALIIVDVQNDFVPGGALAVAGGDAVVPVINDLQSRFGVVVATQDWHPADHASFAANHAGRRVGEVIDLDGLPQMLWPVHCVQETRGAELVETLHTGHVAAVVRKGGDPRVDSYSGFFDNGRRHATTLDGELKRRGVRRVFVCGLATDYCVKFTALDAARLGYETSVIEDACRGVNVTAGDVGRALDEMRAAGVRVIASDSLGGD